MARPARRPERVALLIGWSLLKAHDATECDQLRVQARVIDDNVGQQLDGMSRALASVGDEFLATPVHSVSTLLSGRLKALSDAIPGVRSMVLLDADGNVVASGTPWDLELPFVTAQGNPRWVRAQGVAVCEDGKPVRLLGAFQDITEKKNNALELPSPQRGADAAVDDRCAHGGRQPAPLRPDAEGGMAARRRGSIGLPMIDVDHFKEYNDHYGHPAGDAVMRQMARMVAESVRRGGELVARYGGEEFALLLPGADLDAGRAAAERCRQRVIDAKSRIAPQDDGLARGEHRRRQPGGDGERRLRCPRQDRRRGAVSRQALRPGPDRVLSEAP